MDYDKECNLLNVQCKVGVLLKQHLTDFKDTIFLDHYFYLMHQKYTDRLDLDFIQNFKNEVHDYDDGIESDMRRIHEHILNCNNIELLRDFLRSFLTSFR